MQRKDYTQTSTSERRQEPVVLSLSSTIKPSVYKAMKNKTGGFKKKEESNAAVRLLLWRACARGALLAP